MSFSNSTSTVNSTLQTILEEELVIGVIAAQAKGGWALLMDPTTGAILAHAQTSNSSVPYVFSAREPGSIIKPINYAICLLANDELVAQEKEPIFFPDEWTEASNGNFPGRAKPLKDGRLHKFLNLTVAMQKSSNVYASRTLQRVVDVMGSKWYREKLTEIFGFGSKSLEEESLGYVPTPGKITELGRVEWSSATTHVLALGYNCLATSLQMVRAYAIIANGGYCVTPHLFGQPARKTVKILSSSICEIVTRALKFVTKEGGTSKLGNVPYFTEAGKSGTAEKFLNGSYSKTKNIASFVGFAPAVNPRLVLLVSVDEPIRKETPYGWHQFGGVCAAPIFREIAKRALAYFGVSPDDPYCGTEKSDLGLEAQKLKETYMQFNR